MLYDEISVEQIVDTESALEFMKEATKLATSSELDSIGQKLETKSAIFHERLNPEKITTLNEESLTHILHHIFGLRRKTKRLLRQIEMPGLRANIDHLLHGTEDLSDRFTVFVNSFSGFDEPIKISLAAELLHFTYPDRYWLWSPWIWEESKGGGALPLVMQAEAHISGDTHGAKYESIGKALRVVDAMGHLRGYSGTGKGMFGTDIFMACVYAVYMYTVFRMRLSQEFNRILPELPEMTQRVLGVNHMGKA
jgi:hypothetical protein